MKKRSKAPYIAGIIIIILLGIFFIFNNNNQKGLLKITLPSEEDSVVVFVDNEEQKNVTDNTLRIKKGDHNIIIVKNNYWPWSKDVTIIKQEELEVSPYFIPQNVSGVMIGKEDPEYNEIMRMFREDLGHPEILQTISNETFKNQVTKIEYYKDKENVILFSNSSGIFALEMTENGMENLQPLYKGENPTFVKNDDNSIYVLDGGNLMLVNY